MKRDSAVSPVIGSILLVAITVIIAAVIAAFVFGMTGDIQQTRVVAVTSDVAQNPSVTGAKEIDITNHGGKDAGVLTSIQITINGVQVTTASFMTSATIDDLLTVGGSVRIGGLTAGDRDHLVVTGTFIDGTSQVLLDTYQ